MNKLTCEDIRRELDEVMLGDKPGLATETHLLSCRTCQEFDRTQRQLREMVGNLGTVSAPADFDFKLRARLASEPGANSYHFRPVLKWGMTAATVAVLLVGGITFFRSQSSPMPGDQRTANTVSPTPSNPKVFQAATPEPTSSPGNQDPKENSLAGVVVPPEIPKHVTRPFTKVNRTMGVRDSSFETATTISQPADEEFFTVDTAGQPLTLSLEDRSGNARTISFPAVTFGSQRLVGNANQYATKGVW